MDTIRNKLEMKLLGYTVYSDHENWFSTLSRLLDRYFFIPFQNLTGYGQCEICSRFKKVSTEIVDQEPEHDGYSNVYGWVCEDCYYNLSEKI
ncbi:MAG: hypothetical protein N2505_07080 [Endomicrobia bacterium]|nr:hypothetical protein [Endomicrobiia bacterium]